LSQVRLAEDQHPVQAFTADGANQTLHVWILPRRSRRDRSVADAHRPHPSDQSAAGDTKLRKSVDAFAKSSEVPGTRSAAKALADNSAIECQLRGFTEASSFNARLLKYLHFALGELLGRL
jgi:hypothetical protein